MRIYAFRQNNSGGYFVGPEWVSVRAENFAEANRIAVESGLVYFGNRGDCVECCGHRWAEFSEFFDTVDDYSIFDSVESFLDSNYVPADSLIN